MTRAVLWSLGLSILATTTAFAFMALSPAAGWLALAGAALVAIGAFAGSGGSTVAGVAIIAATSLLAAHERSTGLTIALFVCTAIVSTLLLTATDVSFLSRRSARITRPVKLGMALTSGAVIAVGVTIALALTAGASAVAWPAWMLPVPLVVLAGGLAVSAQRVFALRRRFDEQRPELRRY